MKWRKWNNKMTFWIHLRNKSSYEIKSNFHFFHFTWFTSCFQSITFYFIHLLLKISTTGVQLNTSCSLGSHLNYLFLMKCSRWIISKSKHWQKNESLSYCKSITSYIEIIFTGILRVYFTDRWHTLDSLLYVDMYHGTKQ